MALLTSLVLTGCILGSGLAYYVQSQERLPFFYYQQQRGYWPEGDKSQNYVDDQGFRYHQSYENNYQQNLQYHGYPTYQYQYTAPQVPQQVSQPQVPQPVTQQAQQEEIPQQTPREVSQQPPSYQLLTVGPEVPVLVRLPDHRTTILPARTVYSLPGFLEGIIQNVQNYYSVFNPLEVLKIQPNNSTVLFHPAPAPAPPATPAPTSTSETISPSDTTSASETTSTPESSSTPELSSSSSPAATSEEVVTTETPTTESVEAAETTTEASSEASTE